MHYALKLKEMILSAIRSAGIPSSRLLFEPRENAEVGDVIVTVPSGSQQRRSNTSSIINARVQVVVVEDSHASAHMKDQKISAAITSIAVYDAQRESAEIETEDNVVYQTIRYDMEFVVNSMLEMEH